MACKDQERCILQDTGICTKKPARWRERKNRERVREEEKKRPSQPWGKMH